MSEPTILVDNVSKRFTLRGLGTPTLKSLIVDFLVPGRGQGREFWALRDINFRVLPGETLGIVGGNGAGKSTLLSLLAGTKPPTTGSIRTHGTISSLLELGAGFHPDLTGRENVYLAGAVMGLSRRAMQRRFDAIVAFAGIEDFIDQPVKHYSSGMYVRLGFAVAVEVDPDILLIDEVLAVGDITFQRRCIDKMEEFRRRGKTMLIISHDLPTIQSISDRILLLEGGRLTGLGEPSEMIKKYKESMRQRQLKAMGREWGTGAVTLHRVEVTNAAGEKTDRFRFGESLHATIHYEARERIENPVFGFSISTDAGQLVAGNNTQIEHHSISAVEGKGTLRLVAGPLPLAPGTYLLSFSSHSWDHQVNYHRIDNVLTFTVVGEKTFEGFYLPSRWDQPPAVPGGVKGA